MGKIKKIATGICLGILVLIVAFFVYMQVWFPYHFENPEKHILRSPTGSVTAIILEHGALMGTRESLLIDPGDGKEVIRVGTLSGNDGNKFHHACWSKDGTFIASQSYVTGDCVPRKIKEMNLLIFTHAYDLTKNKLYLPTYDENSPEALIQYSKDIETLLSSRGGQSNTLARDDLYKASVKVSRSEWKKYQELERQH